jgi:hypothetical protein
VVLVIAVVKERIAGNRTAAPAEAPADKVSVG